MIKTRINGRLHAHWSSVLSCTGVAATSTYTVGNMTCNLKLGGVKLLLNKYPTRCFVQEDDWGHFRFENTYSRDNTAIPELREGGCGRVDGLDTFYLSRTWPESFDPWKGGWSNRRLTMRFMNMSCMTRTYLKATVAGTTSLQTCTGPCTCNAVSTPTVSYTNLWLTADSTQAWAARSSPGYNFCDFNAESCAFNAIRGYFDFNSVFDVLDTRGMAQAWQVMVPLGGVTKGTPLNVVNREVVVPAQALYTLVTDKVPIQSETCVEGRPNLNSTTLCGGQTSCVLLQDWLPPNDDTCLTVGTTVSCSVGNVVSVYKPDCSVVVSDYDEPTNMEPEQPCTFCLPSVTIPGIGSITGPITTALTSVASLLVLALIVWVALKFACSLKRD